MATKKNKVDFLYYKNRRYPKGETYDTFYGPIPKKINGRTVPVPVDFFVDGCLLGKYSPNNQRNIYTDDAYYGKLEYQAVAHIDRSNYAKYRFGFECEKEDSLASHSPVDYLAYGFAPEQDGSLDDGFELVSPMFDLFTDDLDKIIDESRAIKADINADVSNSCGGHMSISQAGVSGVQLYDEIENWIPLLMALYPKRLNNSYCQPQQKNQVREARGDRRAISISENRIEFRIFPSIKSVKNLKWRRDLLRLMIENRSMTHLQIAAALKDKRTKLGRLMDKVYSDRKRLDKADIYLGICFLFNSSQGVRKKYVSRVKEVNSNLHDFYYGNKSSIVVNHFNETKDNEVLEVLI